MVDVLSYDPSNLLLLVLGVGALVLKVYALVDAVRQNGEAFPAAGKLTKPIWIAILVAALLLGRANVIGIFGLVSLIAAIVYLVDVRPAVRGIVRGGPWA